MNKKYYTCKYCFEEYVPKRRRVQKYCSGTCRSKACYERKQSKKTTTKKPQEELEKSTKAIIDKVSISGVTNAALGTLMIELLKWLTISKENKTATKADLKTLEDKLKRYHRVNNLEPRMDGTIPYFDMETKTIIYMSSLFNFNP
jgi:hypothetical protein